MASTPSASSLSAVLRCRGDIWTGNPPAKRPAASHSPGLSSAERSAPSRGSERRGSPRGELPVAGRGLSVVCRWETGEEEKSVWDVYRIKDGFYGRKFAQPSAPPVRSAPPGGGELVSKPETAGLLLPGVLKLSLTLPVLPPPVSTVRLTWLRSRTGDPQLQRNHPTQTQQESSRSRSGPEVTEDTPD